MDVIEFSKSVRMIREVLAELFGTQMVKNRCKILYGGSVTAETVQGYITNGGDGVLAGGASQSLSSCSALIQALAVKT